MEYINTVETVNKLLTDNNEWIVRYKNYAKKSIQIKNNTKKGEQNFEFFLLFTFIRVLVTY